MSRKFSVIAFLCALTACERTRTSEHAANGAAAPATCDQPARDVIAQFGARMRTVSVLGPDTAVAREIRSAYAPLVTDQLLAQWLAGPASAPGRDVSNPWPARIVIDSISTDSVACRVHGAIVYVTTTDTMTPVSQKQVQVGITDYNGWRVSAWDAVSADTARSAQQVLRDYYDAINAHDYRRAHGLWENGGEASGKTLAEFTKGFRETERVHLQVVDGARVEGAAGSQYTTVPVVLDAVLRSGQRQHFEGHYTLRRSMVDGATPEQRRWRIYSAKLQQASR